MAAAVPVLPASLVYERRKKALDGSPLVDLDLFRQRSFVPGLLLAGIFFMGIPQFFLTFSLWLQIGLGFSALHAGLTGALVRGRVGAGLGRVGAPGPALGRRILSAGCRCWSPAWSRSCGRSTATAAPSAPGSCSRPCSSAAWLGSVVAPLVNVVLAGIRGCGGRLGVLTTVQQIGGPSGWP